MTINDDTKLLLDERGSDMIEHCGMKNRNVTLINISILKFYLIISRIHSYPFGSLIRLNFPSEILTPSNTTVIIFCSNNKIKKKKKKISMAVMIPL